MKNKIIFLSSLIILGSLTLLPKSMSEPNFQYQIYTPYNYQTVEEHVANAQQSSQILFIVDFSNSMNDTIGGKSKLDMARDTLASILPKIPPNVKTGLRVYGHKAGFTYLQGCQASHLSVPLNSGNYQAILSNLYSTKATGWTPITYSLKQAINNDFSGLSGKKHIILLTDGGENCDESPCTYVINMMKTRNDVTIDVIAFDIHDAEANNQLRCTALMTSGKFLTAESESDLSNSLFETVGIKKDVRGSIKMGEDVLENTTKQYKNPFGY